VVFDIVFILLLGTVFGSFLNVLIYRLPLGISLINPKRSQCPQCKTTISWYHNIPILSYLALQGKCSVCKKKIPLNYLFVEILTPFITLVLFAKLGLTLEFTLITLICYILLVLSFIDFKYHAVPDLLLVILALLSLVYLFYFKIENISTFFMFAGGIVILELFVTYYIQNIKAKILKDESLKMQKSLGEGDIPIIALTGGILGLKFGLIAIFLSAILAIIPSLINAILKKEIETPFIPYLSLAFFITYTNEQTIINILEGLKLV